MEEKFKVKLGYAPTRRSVFSRDDAIKYKILIMEKMTAMNIEFVDLEWLNDEGLLYDAVDAEKVAVYFKSQNVDAIFVPHCNFGNEEAVSKLAKIMDKPVLLWGPRDEYPIADYSRLRDSQCGLFATSKVMTRFGVPFSYIENCRIEEPVFEEGLDKFISAACIVKNFRNMKIGQIGTRPTSFMSVMCNEGELLEKFGIQVIPVSLIDISNSMSGIQKNYAAKIEEDVSEVKARLQCDFSDETIIKMISLKYAMKEWAEKESLSAIAIQCWDAFQDITGIMPCFANSELTMEGIPVVCETDICGAVTAVIAQSAVRGKTPIFFADVTVRHPENDNAELLWHCGSFPLSLKKESSEARLSSHYVLDSKCPGVNEWEIKGGEITIARFDGVNGLYSMLAAKGKGVEGPRNRGTYVWVEFKDWPALEKKIIYGPYIHHVAGVHANIIPAIEEALKFLPVITPDFVD